MARTSTISSKGQITIPLEIRQRLGVKPGDRVRFDFDKGLTILRPACLEENPFEQFAGSLPAFNSIEESNAWLRDMRGHDPEEL
jgi:AbrB family looped-hinge helix DNA binding protein